MEALITILPPDSILILFSWKLANIYKYFALYKKSQYLLQFESHLTHFYNLIYMHMYTYNALLYLMLHSTVS